MLRCVCTDPMWSCLLNWCSSTAQHAGSISADTLHVSTGKPSRASHTHPTPSRTEVTRISSKQDLAAFCADCTALSGSRAWFGCDLEMGMEKVVLDDVAEMLSQSMMMALCAKPPRLYPRSRWTEAEETVEEIAILEACHSNV